MDTFELTAVSVKETEEEKLVRLLKSLPPLVAVVVRDVMNNNITEKTILLADEVSEEEWEKYAVVRCVATGNPKYPPITEARACVEVMLKRLP
jgi:hypothetical protein